MRIIAFIIFMLMLPIKGATQSGGFSTDLGANYTYYFIGTNNTNHFNYGVNLMLFKHIKNLQVGTGIGYGVKHFTEPYNSGISLQKMVYRLQYFHYQIVFGYNINNSGPLNYGIGTGFIFHRISDYRIESYYNNGDYEIEKDLLSNRIPGCSSILKLAVSKPIGNAMELYAATIAGVKIINEKNGYKSFEYRSVPNDRLSFSVQIGIEYFFGS